MSELSWLPAYTDFREQLKTVADATTRQKWTILQSLANSRLSFIETVQLDRTFQRCFPHFPPPELQTKPIRLSVLSSSSSEHLLPGIRLGGLRRGLYVSTYTPDYNQYLQEILSPTSGLHSFKPTTILFAFDAAHLFGMTTCSITAQAAEEKLDAACDKLTNLWRIAKDRFECEVFQQTLLARQPMLMGNNEHRLPGSQYQLTQRLNERLRTLADAEGVNLLAIDDQIATQGLNAWHDPIYWHKAKQEISPLATPLYGDLLGRMLAAAQGRSSKCLVLDLDNTLWGGIIGDDGLEGIKLGQGSAAGEAYLEIQRYALELSQRGIILAVCSKNDEVNALAPFDQHPDMILKRSDIACFVANWNDKAANLRHIAQSLNIGLDSLVFVDDNPFERNMVRRELPMVAVPELSDDPASYTATVAAGGYFESLGITDDDKVRAEQYQANVRREALKTSISDVEGYLASLQMELEVQAFDAINLPRIVQLINKTNQFNLTTRRYTEADIKAIMQDENAFTLQLRLTDRFGDNGMIGTVIGTKNPDNDIAIDTWLMSCRVLGRGVEAATLLLVVEQSLKLKARNLIGIYKPTAKNGMVESLYERLGFAPVPSEDQSANTSHKWLLALDTFTTYDTPITIKRVGA